MKVVKIDFYKSETLPERLKIIAENQNVKLSGLIAVKTMCCPPTYEFNIIKNPFDLLDYMKKLAEQDGADLNEVVKKLER